MKKDNKEYQQQSLNNALNNQSFANYQAIFDGFIDLGINPDDIKPRENIFTFNAWKALNRSVLKGQHGVKIVTFIKGSNKDKQGNDKPYSYAKTTTVFHISQTKLIEENENTINA